MGKGQYLQYMVLGKLHNHMQKNEIGPLSYSTLENQFKNTKESINKYKSGYVKRIIHPYQDGFSLEVQCNVINEGKN